MEFEMKRNSFAKFQHGNSLQSFKQIKQKTPEILHFHLSLYCSIASVTSYLSENKAENLQNGDVHLPKFITLKWNISRTIWRIEVGDGLLFWHFLCSFI